MGISFYDTEVNMDFPDRIRTIIKVNNLTVASFADRIGVQRSGVSHILNGRNKPSVDFLEKVLAHFPRIDAGWLLTGKAPGEKRDALTEADSRPGASVRRPTLASSIKETGENRRITRIVVFYDDRTFDTYESNE
jgi:transcriptional regulator with XRE-family HTH domain